MFVKWIFGNTDWWNRFSWLGLISHEPQWLALVSTTIIVGKLIWVFVRWSTTCFPLPSLNLKPRSCQWLCLTYSWGRGTPFLCLRLRLHLDISSNTFDCPRIHDSTLAHRTTGEAMKIHHTESRRRMFNAVVIEAFMRKDVQARINGLYPVMMTVCRNVFCCSTGLKNQGLRFLDGLRYINGEFANFSSTRHLIMLHTHVPIMLFLSDPPTTTSNIGWHWVCIGRFSVIWLFFFVRKGKLKTEILQEVGVHKVIIWHQYSFCF